MESVLENAPRTATPQMDANAGAARRHRAESHCCWHEQRNVSLDGAEVRALIHH